MSVVSTGFVSTASAGRHIQQLCMHWSHKPATTYEDGRGEVPFSQSDHASFEALSDGIAITLTTYSLDADARMRGVIERHLDRFAFREAPLAYRWNNAGS